MEMTSFDVDSLFTNIPFDDTINICTDKLFQNPKILVNGTCKNDFCYLLNLATKDSLFTFNSKLYIPVNGVAMGCPISPILANIFFSHHEETWLNACPIEFIPTLYRRYPDNFFFSYHLNLLTRFQNMFFKHWNINFSGKHEEPGSQFVKKTVNLLLAFNESQHLPVMKIAFQRTKKRLLCKLLHRSFRKCCDSKTFRSEIDHLKTMFRTNNHNHLLVRVIKSFPTNFYTPKVIYSERKTKCPFLKSEFVNI